MFVLLGQVQVLTAKSDVDGTLEAQLAFLTRGGHRLFYLNEEAQGKEKLSFFSEAEAQRVWSC